jgi:hypothetical protein
VRELEGQLEDARRAQTPEAIVWGMVKERVADEIRMALGELKVDSDY